MFLPGESQGRWSLVGCRLWGRTESDTTERLHFHFSLSCIGKDPDAGKDRGQEEKGMTEDEMIGWHHRRDGLEFE